MKKLSLLFIAFLLVGAGCTVAEEDVVVLDFIDCVDAGNPVMESYPRQCRHGDETFVEDVGNELEVMDKIQISYPRPGATISSPLNIEGTAVGTWYFEATFPVVLVDWDGLIIAEGYATANGDWMTEDFVPFTATLEFETPTLYDNGALILQKDNPSGLPEYDAALEIPIIFESM
ncbi:MAG: Gmad2 immunoglobulin-like domain-containing protein [Candidatus Uhrbacteria bacterium]|nr:Gmad2 immunoglobulin-like domain-containing protein [Candidatus Uhrbacteria bacterium]